MALYLTRGFSAGRHLQLHGAGTRLPDICTIRTVPLVRVWRARLHLIRWPLLAKASGACLLRLCSAITSTQCGPEKVYWTAFCIESGQEKMSFQDCISYECVCVCVCMCACVCVRAFVIMRMLISKGFTYTSGRFDILEDLQTRTHALSLRFSCSVSTPSNRIYITFIC